MTALSQLARALWFWACALLPRHHEPLTPEELRRLFPPRLVVREPEFWEEVELCL